MNALVDRLIEDVRRLIADVAREQIAKAMQVREWFDQDSSPLSREVHLRLCRSGTLPSHKVGKRVLVHCDEMNRFIQSHPSAATVPARESGDEIDRELRGLGIHPDQTRTPARRREAKRAA